MIAYLFIIYYNTHKNAVLNHLHKCHGTVERGHNVRKKDSL